MWPGLGLCALHRAQPLPCTTATQWRGFRQSPLARQGVCGSKRLHNPVSASREVAIPDSALTPTPVSTTTRCAAADAAAARQSSVSRGELVYSAMAGWTRTYRSEEMGIGRCSTARFHCTTFVKNVQGGTRLAALLRPTALCAQARAMRPSALCAEACEPPGVRHGLRNERCGVEEAHMAFGAGTLAKVAAPDRAWLVCSRALWAQGARSGCA